MSPEDQEMNRVIDSLQRAFSDTLQLLCNYQSKLILERNSTSPDKAKIDKLNDKIESILKELDSIAVSISDVRRNYEFNKPV